MSTDPILTPSWSDQSVFAGLPAWALDDVPFGIGLLRLPDLVFVYSNRLYESWYQPERRPIVGKRLDEALSVAPQVVSVFRDVATRGEPTHFHDVEFVGLKERPIVLPGDVTRWDWSIWPLKDEQGEVAHLLVSGYDVSAQALDRLKLARAHDEGIRALLEVSRVAGVTGSIEDFFGELSRTVGRLVGAGKVVFTRVKDGAMFVLPHTYGFDDDLLSGLSVPCSAEGNALADGIVYRDETFKARIGSGPEFEPYREALAMIDVSDAIALAWRAGDQRLGLVAAFNSTAPGGFTDVDLHVLKTASMAAGLVWQHRETRTLLAAVEAAENRRLRDTARELAALEQRKAEFLRFASHEMRGPINIISAYASMLAEGSFGELTEPMRESTVIIAQKIHDLNRIVDQVLEASRLEDPSLRLDLTTFDLREIVPYVLEQAHHARRSTHAFKVELGPVPVYVRADRERVLMIAANLIDNAIKYSPAGGEIRCTTRRSGHAAEIRITDQGIGIAADDLPRLFARFSRVGGAATEAVRGTGLGLYLCREAARMLGGDVHVESALGAGSTFWLELPLAPQA
jgi:signal transduction histidine kinase